MKSVGILTFHYPNNANFGASLQSFACTKMVEKLGYRAQLIDYNPTIFKLKRFLIYRVIANGFYDFNKKFLKTTKRCRSDRDLKKLNGMFDIFLVGSDQVWRAHWLGENAVRYFFDFVDSDKKKISYAASFGIDRWEAEEKLTEKIIPLVREFNNISVREKSGVDICREVFAVDAQCVLDPTLMLDKEDYREILEDAEENTKGEGEMERYAAYMFLDDTLELEKFREEIGRYLNLSLKNMYFNEHWFLRKRVVIFKRVSQWLKDLKESSLVITDSFHCAVFSLIFNKKFIVIANERRGITRLKNLLTITGLEERFFTDIKEVIESGVLEREIDYSQVEAKLSTHRESSKRYLERALKD